MVFGQASVELIGSCWLPPGVGKQGCEQQADLQRLGLLGGLCLLSWTWTRLVGGLQLGLGLFAPPLLEIGARPGQFERLRIPGSGLTD